MFGASKIAIFINITTYYDDVLQYNAYPEQMLNFEAIEFCFDNKFNRNL